VPPTENPATQIESALANGNFGLALRISGKLVATSKRSLLGWVSRARANLGLGRICDADEDLDVAIRLAPDDAQANLLRGMVDQRLGRIDRAVDRLRKLAASKSPYAIEASVMFAETLYFSHRRDEFRKFVEAGGAWTNDARGPLMTARVRAVADPSGALEDLLAITRGTSSVVLRRVAGFDAVQMLDKAGRYREAFDLAAHLHSTTTPPFDVDGLRETVREQRELLKQGRAWCAPRVESVAGVAMVVGLPRCGTTLLEQMLDGHSKISGIGEYDGVEIMGTGIVSTGIPMRNLSMLPREAGEALQSAYLRGAMRLRRDGAQWVFDKNLRAWKWLPVVAAILPGAVCFHVARDPRDMAISTFLSFFNPITDGWTGKIDSLRSVIEAERSILPNALETLGIPHESIVYENLVADPTGHAKRCLDRLGLEAQASVLQPELNMRTVFTLSHEQVRKPINNSSIGRWENYAWAFDGAWDSLAAVHDARRGR
jgi:tetratricopeptide (TPR) repeat protein